MQSSDKRNFLIELKQCEQQYETLRIENEDEVARYYKLKRKLELVQEQMSGMMNEPKYLVPFLQPGRLVTVGDHEEKFSICSSLS